MPEPSATRQEAVRPNAGVGTMPITVDAARRHRLRRGRVRAGFRRSASGEQNYADRSSIPGLPPATSGSLLGLPKHLQPHLRLGLKARRLGNVSQATASRILQPALRKVEPHVHRRVRVRGGQRERDGDLAACDLAQGAAVLRLHPDGVMPGLGKGCVVQNQGQHRAVLGHRLQRIASGQKAQVVIGPGRVAQRVQQALVLCIGGSRSDVNRAAMGSTLLRGRSERRPRV